MNQNVPAARCPCGRDSQAKRQGCERCADAPKSSRASKTDRRWTRHGRKAKASRYYAS